MEDSVDPKAGVEDTVAEPPGSRRSSDLEFRRIGFERPSLEYVHASSPKAAFAIRSLPLGISPTPVCWEGNWMIRSRRGSALDTHPLDVFMGWIRREGPALAVTSLETSTGPECLRHSARSHTYGPPANPRGDVTR